MAIIFNKEKKTFSLHTAKTTYQLKIGNLNYVNHLYYGAAIRDDDLSYLIRSGRDISSHQQNPFIALAESEANEDYGSCYGFALMYSGSFVAEVELDQYDQCRLVMGINDRQFSYALRPGEDFDTPAVLMTYTHKGLTGMSHRYHDFFRNNLNSSKFIKDVRRPVLINTWEAAFFDFDDKKLVEIAKAAKGMGVEMVVMHAGIPVPREVPEFTSFLYHLKAVDR